MNKAIIAGSRDFTNYDLLAKSIDELNITIDTIVSGHARGADALGERYAQEKNIKLELFPADWENEGKAAGYIRNTAMAKVSNILICFWDGKSKGTKHMLDIAKKHNLKTYLFLIKPSEVTGRAGIINIGRVKEPYKGKHGIYVGRGSPLGNPYPITEFEGRNLVCDKYELWFNEKVKLRDSKIINELNKILSLALTDEITLLCYCYPKRCHAETIKKFLDSCIEKGLTSI